MNDAQRAEKIDRVFREKSGYPWIPYEKIGEVLVEEVRRQGKNGLYISTACALVEQESYGKLRMSQFFPFLAGVSSSCRPLAF